MRFITKDDIESPNNSKNKIIDPPPSREGPHMMFIFYDTETTGLQKSFSQIVQIALVFTDDNMNILSSKKLESRRSPWVIPSPGSMLITGFTPDDLKNAKLSHFEMMQETDKWIRSQYQPILFSGFNTMGYDEDVLSHNLHQTLLDPWLTISRNDANGQQNGHFDIDRVVRAVVAYMPGTLKLDILNEQGYPSLSLMNVASQNGVPLNHEDAHDAMNDIRATVGLAKVMKKLAPQIWDHMLTLSTQAGVEDFMAKNKVFTQGWTVSGKRGGVVVTAAASREGDTSEILFDLGQDPTPFLSMTAEQLRDAILAQDEEKNKYKKKAFRVADKDRQPLIMPLDMSDAVLPATFDEKLAETRADMIQSNAQFRQNLGKAAAMARDVKYPPYANPKPEQLMNDYPEGPVKAKVEAWTKEFRAAPTWKDAAALLGDFYTRFEQELKQDPKLRSFVQFAGRIVFEHAPTELSQEQQDQMKVYIASHVLNQDPKASYTTIAIARKELAEIEKERAEGRPRWKEVTDTQIRSLKLYYTALEKEYAPYLPASAPVPPVNDNAAPPVAPTKKAANDKFKPK